MKAKLAVMGESGVGKTSLILRFVRNEFQDAYVQTVGTRVSKVELQVPHGAGVEVQLDLAIFDIGGEAGFRDLVQETYYHGAHALMAVADITVQKSLSALSEWIPAALGIAGDVPLYLVVNKKDLGRSAITDAETRSFAGSFQAPYVLTSAQSGTPREAGSPGLRKHRFSRSWGVRSDEIQAELDRLEGEGFVTIIWYGATDFNAAVTPRGVKALKQASEWDEE